MSFIQSFKKAVLQHLNSDYALQAELASHDIMTNAPLGTTYRRYTGKTSEARELTPSEKRWNAGVLAAFHIVVIVAVSALCI